MSYLAVTVPPAIVRTMSAMDAPNVVGGPVQEPAARGAGLRGWLRHSQLGGYGARHYLAVLRRRDGERLTGEPHAVARREDLGMAGAQLLVHLHVTVDALDAEAVEQRLQPLLADGLDDLVRGEHELAAWYGLGPAAAALVRQAEPHAHAAHAGYPAALAQDLDGLGEEPDVHALAAHEVDLEVVSRHLRTAAAVEHSDALRPQALGHG